VAKTIPIAKAIPASSVFMADLPNFVECIIRQPCHSFCDARHGMVFSPSMPERRIHVAVEPATLSSMAPEINLSAHFLSNKAWLGIALARLICTRCRADTKSVLRCRACGALCPTTKLGPAMLSPSAFAFYILVLAVVAVFWFW
jgi:hypothetical protein